jgi:progressive ankylosis protein
MYWRLTTFVFPLVLTIIIYEFGVQFLNAGMARMPNATETLAAYGLAYGLLLLLSGPLAQSRQMSLVLVEDRRSLRQTWLFVLAICLLLMLLQLSMVMTPLGQWLIDDLHQIDARLATMVRTVLLWLLPIPLLRSTALFLSGPLIRARRTEVISYATVASMAGGIVTVFALLPLESVRANPIWLPILATYSMTILELAVIAWGMRRYIKLPEVAQHTVERGALTYEYIIRFFWPLALIMVVQELSRPLINLFIARGADGTLSLAVLTVAYALGQWPYRWLNEIRNLPTAFVTEDPGLVRVRRFAFTCGLLSFAISIVLFWTPVRDFVLMSLIGVDAELALLAHTPLALFAFFSFVVMIRAYLHGIALLERRTRALALSGPARLASILLVLIVLPFTGVAGATLGVAALLAGFTGETIMVWWGVRGHDLFAARAQAREAAATR